MVRRSVPIIGILWAALLVLTVAPLATAAEESDYYRIVTLPIPDDIRLEVGGLATLPDGRIAAATRSGDVWLIENATDDPPGDVRYHRFASGLHEPLGLSFHKGDLYTTQRTEVTRLSDSDGDDRADAYITAAKGWGVTGNYHEYAYGPVFDPEGDMWVTLNTTIGGKRVEDDAWRGWSLKVKPDGSWAPVSGGLRSPAGLGLNAAGDVFAIDHQGNWFPVCPLLHLREGVFHGHADALKDCERPGATFEHPGKLPSGLTVVEAAERIGPYKLPVLWFPYRKMGMGSTDILCDTTGGKFGPFENQLFVGDFTMALISRVWLEKVGGAYQGACFPFRDGFQSAVFRMAFGKDGSMFVGQTNRGWNSQGSRTYGLQRLVWTGRTPFEIKTMSARPDGFALTFTKPVDPETAGDPDAYRMSSYTYHYHQSYGSDEIKTKQLNIRSVEVSDDRRTVRLRIDGLRTGYVHELHAEGVRSAEGKPLLHAFG